MEDENTRAAKLRRLETFRRKLPYLSCSALEQVLNLVQKEGCPELHSRKNIKQAVDVTLQDLSSYGQLIEDVEVITISGGRKEFLCSTCPHFYKECLLKEDISFSFCLTSTTKGHPVSKDHGKAFCMQMSCTLETNSVAQLERLGVFISAGLSWVLMC